MITTTSLILILNVTMLLANATVTSIQSYLIMKGMKRNDD